LTTEDVYPVTVAVIGVVVITDKDVALVLPPNTVAVNVTVVVTELVDVKVIVTGLADPLTLCIVPVDKT